MAPSPGYKARVLAGEFDLSSMCTQTDYAKERALIDVTTYKPGTVDQPDRDYIAGLASGSVTLGGLWDPAAGASDEVVAAVMDGSRQVVTVSWQGAVAVGDRAICADGLQTGAPIESSLEDAVKFSSARQGSGAVKGGVVLHPVEAETGAGNFASVDNAVLGNGGAVANLHVLAFSGTSATVKVTDSTDDSVFADLITFTAVTAVGSERAAAVGLVNRYARVELTGTFTSITFAVSFARL